MRAFFLDESQRRFAYALRDADAPTPSDWIGPSGEVSPRRFGVYRNNVIAGLARTLGDAYPVVRRLVGTEFFHAMACDHVRVELPQSPMLHEYGAGFAMFIERFAPAASLQYLADVARFERAWVECYHAAEMQPLDEVATASLPLLDFESVRLILHPSMRLLSSCHPVRTIWGAHQQDAVISNIEVAEQAQDTLFIRPAAQVLVVALRPGAFSFIGHLAAGLPPALAYEETLALWPAFDLGSTIADMVACDAFVAIEKLSSFPFDGMP